MRRAYEQEEEEEEETPVQFAHQPELAAAVVGGVAATVIGDKLSELEEKFDQTPPAPIMEFATPTSYAPRSSCCLPARFSTYSRPLLPTPRRRRASTCAPSTSAGRCGRPA